MKLLLQIICNKRLHYKILMKKILLKNLIIKKILHQILLNLKKITQGIQNKIGCNHIQKYITKKIWEIIFNP
jgi:hypothetical protein